MKFIIPDSFEIAGRTYEVKYVKKCTNCTNNIAGQVRYQAIKTMKNGENNG